MSATDVRFGPYLLHEQIGEGGAARVFRAKHATTGASVALLEPILHRAWQFKPEDRYSTADKMARELPEEAVEELRESLDDGP